MPSPGHFASHCWQPSIYVSITLPASPALCLHYLTNDIMPFCVLVPALLPLHRSLILPLLFLLPVSLHASVLPVVSPRCRVSLHINRTLVTAFSASSCLLSPSRCSIYSIMYLHTPAPPHHSPFFPPASSIRLCLPLFSQSPSFPLCPSCPLLPSVLTTYNICHPNPPSFFLHSSSIATLPSLPSVLFPTLPLLFSESLKLYLLPVPPYLATSPC